MALIGNVFQYKDTVSLPKEPFIEHIVYNDELTKKDLKLLMFLITQLNGCKRKDKDTEKDHYDYRMVNPATVAENTGLSKSDVRSSLSHLVDLEILEEGVGGTVKHGYRFTF